MSGDIPAVDDLGSTPLIGQHVPPRSRKLVTIEHVRNEEKITREAEPEKSSIERWFVVAKDYDDTDPVEKHWVKSPVEAAGRSASRRGGLPANSWSCQLGWPHGHLAEPGGPTPPGTQFDVFPLDESSTISDVLQAEKISVKGKWWVDDSLLVRPG